MCITCVRKMAVNVNVLGQSKETEICKSVTPAGLQMEQWEKG